MASIKDDCICVRHWDFSETSQTVGVFGRETGLFRAIAKGSRRPKAAFSGGIDLLSRADSTHILKHGADLGTLCSWELSQSYPRIRQDIKANRAAFYAADLVGLLLQPGDPHPNTFDALVAFLEGLSRGDCVDRRVLIFQLAALWDAGLYPRLNPAEACQFEGVYLFSSSDGGLLRTPSADPQAWRVSPSTINVINEAAKKQQPHTISDHGATVRANRLMAAHLRCVLHQEPYTMRAYFGEIATTSQSKPND
ncbi:MAG: DNA repair protein RecO [Phycisphaerales bacterium]|nr:DNA repair protein RecO [Phycisphaerales bacterium]